MDRSYHQKTETASLDFGNDGADTSHWNSIDESHINNSTHSNSHVLVQLYNKQVYNYFYKVGAILIKYDKGI